MTGRREGDDHDRTPDTVVDLTGEGGARVWRRATNDDARSDDREHAESDADDARRAVGSVRHGGLTRRVLWTLAPAGAAMCVALLIALVAAFLVGGSSQRAGYHERDAARAESAAAALDAVDASVLQFVAGGVGQQLSSSDDVARNLGAAERVVVLEVARGDTPLSTEAAEAASASHLDYVAAVGEAMAAAEGPVELGNELDRLEELHDTASVAWRALASSERSAAAEQRAQVRSTLWIGLIAAAAATLCAIALVGVARRRLESGLDRPVRGLGAAIRGVALGGGPTVPTQGFSEIVALSADLVRARADIESIRRVAADGERERQILEALELADDESAARDVIERALIDTARPVELLLAPRGTSRLEVAAVNPELDVSHCPVAGTAACTALRRGQVSTFVSSESINTCPYLRGRPEGPLSAVCVPVTIAARPAGVLHMTGPDGAPPPPSVAEDLVGLATSVGARFSSLRTLESSRQEAATDGLTGLPNRRTFETEVAALVEQGTPFVLALADLDKFKGLNDKFGHEVGDRALQLFASVLRDNVRGNDLVARLGGEEFVLVYPNLATEVTLEAIARLNAALERGLEASNLPAFTCSFGVATSSDGVDGDSILRVADAGLLEAKELGGNSVVVADSQLVAKVFDEEI